MLTADDETRMRALLEGPHGGRDSLGYFALRRDKSVVWSPSGKAAIAYRVLSGVLLASGDPLGDPEAWPGAIKEFMQAGRRARLDPRRHRLQRSGRHRVRPGRRDVGAGIRRRGRRRARRLLARRTRDAQRAPGLRTSGAGRLHRAGVPLRARSPTEERIQLREQAAAWRGSETERGFSMALGRFGDPADGRVRGGHGVRRRAQAAGIPALRAVGRRRPFARPDAARS